MENPEQKRYYYGDLQWLIEYAGTHPITHFNGNKVEWGTAYETGSGLMERHANHRKEVLENGVSIDKALFEADKRTFFFYWGAEALETVFPFTFSFDAFFVYKPEEEPAASSVAGPQFRFARDDRLSAPPFFVQ